MKKKKRKQNQNQNQQGFLLVETYWVSSSQPARLDFGKNKVYLYILS